MNRFEQVRIASCLIEAAVREDLQVCKDVTSMFRLAFKDASEYLMSTDDDVRFKGGIGAVMLHLGTDHPEYKRIEIELEQLKTLSAAMSGIPVDWAQTPTMPDDFEAIGIVKLWKEINQ